MNINNINETNFKGGFRLTGVSSELKNEIPKIIKKHRQIFYDVKTPNDVFITVRDNIDLTVANIIRKNRLNFEYYKTINTKSGLDDEKPEKLVALLRKTKEAPITTMTQLNKHIADRKIAGTLEQKSPEYVATVLKTLQIKNKNDIKETRGVRIVTDSEFNRKIYISRPSKLNIHYVKIVPDSLDLLVKRYAIDGDGNILARYQTPDGIKIFNTRFNQLLLEK